jgi:hypothetical protein
MKKQILNKIPALKNNDGKLSGGFSSLSLEQINKINGGSKSGTNRKNCGNKVCHDNNYCSIVAFE